MNGRPANVGVLTESDIGLHNQYANARHRADYDDKRAVRKRRVAV